MKYFSENDEYVNAACEHCDRILKIVREHATPNASGFVLNPPSGVRCICGVIHHEITGRADCAMTSQSSGFSRGSSSKMVCPHCQTKGSVRTKKVKRKKGISGAKATGAILTAGFSLLATGLSKKEKVTEARCNACGAIWHYS